MNESIRTQIRGVLRSKLIGPENFNNKKLVMENLNISESTIKSWTAPSSINIPLADDIPLICEILKITYYDLFGTIDHTILEKDNELLKAYKTTTEERKEIIDYILNIK